ncbi:hypothetical protein [Streptomyces antibioticus]|uniref:hypothetical protein n=1 Tax=Streptomyces antibioticus TaxID=1890 RepID=UPI0036D8AF64
MAAKDKKSPKGPTDQTTYEPESADPQGLQAEGSVEVGGESSVGVAVDQYQNRYSDYQK